MKQIKRYLVGTALCGALAVASAGCGDSGAECGAGTVEQDGVCVPTADVCGDGTTFNAATGECEGDIECAPGTVLEAGECVPDGSVICGTGTTYNEDTGECDPDITDCGTGTVLDPATGECVDPASLWDPDVTEPAEPNGFEDTPGMFDFPAEGSDVTIGGCVVPTDFDSDGVTDADMDVFLFTADAPALVDISVEGTGGQSGGFLIVAADDQLSADGFVRAGINLVDETAQRQVYLPKAGLYAIAFTDGRSLLGTPAGGADACYFATISNIAIPTPTPISGGSVTGTFENDTQFFSYAPAEGDILFNTLTAPSPAALSDFVQVVNDGYAGIEGDSRPDGSQRAWGSNAFNLLDGLAAADTVVYVIDPIINNSLDPIDFTLDVVAPVSGALPTAGTTTVTNDGFNDRWLYFDAQAGDILELDLNSDGGDFLDVAIVGPGLAPVSQPCSYAASTECDSLDSFFQLPVSGRYYLRLFDTDILVVDPPPASFDITVAHQVTTPTAFTGGVTAAALGGHGVTFYEYDASAADWVGFTGDPTSFGGDMEVLFFDRNAAGELNVDVLGLDGFTFTAGGGEDFGRVLAGDDSLFLVGVRDGGMVTGTGTFDFAVTDRTFTDTGATPVSMSAVASLAGATDLFLVSGTASELLALAVTPNGTFDAELQVFDREENVTVIDLGGASEDEVYQKVAGMGPASYLAFAVVNNSGTDEAFDLTVNSAAATATYTSTPALTIPDNDDAGVTDTLNVPATCVLLGITVDVDVSHTWKGDVILELTSPGTTLVRLHDRTGGWADDIIGNYPGTLVPAESLDAFVGEDAMGDWDMFVSDGAAGDTGTLNEWSITVFCE
jgi:subtilisin-like proprotein convertase family protein